MLMFFCSAAKKLKYSSTLDTCRTDAEHFSSAFCPDVVEQIAAADGSLVHADPDEHDHVHSLLLT
jgi:hypothetical protein